ncbi:alpha-L-arabinofuranosidase C-terminal domain-containing protein [Bacteroidota bacterium]
MKKSYLIPLLAGLFFYSTCNQPSPISENTITIDPEIIGEPISKYIYGQFIEHLGRCIYGGIWAEMLEDRKFYYPITDDYSPWGTSKDDFWKAGEFPILTTSPWKVIGPEGCVKMDSNDPFVGEHTPVITTSGDGEAGIGQEGLVLVSGKEYEGRIYLSGTTNDIEVQLRITGGQSGDQVIKVFQDLTPGFTKFSFQFSTSEDIENASLEIAGTGNGAFLIGTLSLIPSDNIQGFNPEVIKYLKELNAPIYRWPGGNFVSGYDWTDGIGDPDKRPPRKNPAWTGIEHNDVGMHEYMELCGLINTEPFIAVNTGLGTVEEVAKQVAYCNSPADTPMGKIRAENGQTEPFNVEYWAVGNEMYGDWQLGHIPLEEYVKKHNKMAEAMWTVDSEIKLVAVGHAGEWSQAMMTECSGHMNLISEHIYGQEKKDVVEHVKQMTNDIRRVAKAHREYRKTIPELADKDIRIAMDEWNYWYGDYIYGELGCVYHLKDALGIAAGFHEYFRNSDLYFMANYAQTVNVIGAIKTTKKAVEFETTGLILKLYREHFEEIPVEITGTPEPLDVFAAVDHDGKILTLGIINPTEKAIDFNLEIPGREIDQIQNIWEVAGDDPMAYNEPGKSRNVDVIERSADFKNYIKVSSFSVTLIKAVIE